MTEYQFRLILSGPFTGQSSDEELLDATDALGEAGCKERGTFCLKVPRPTFGRCPASRKMYLSPVPSPKQNMLNYGLVSMIMKGNLRT